MDFSVQWLLNCAGAQCLLLEFFETNSDSLSKTRWVVTTAATTLSQYIFKYKNIVPMTNPHIYQIMF